MYFYPRPPRGGRHSRPTQAHGSGRFLSTPSARRATGLLNITAQPSLNFYPRPPRGGRRLCAQQRLDRVPISIHALREEGDPRPSKTQGLRSISIHALREEGDATSSISLMAASIFLSTPSARRATGYSGEFQASGLHFYPRPPRGGRPSNSALSRARRLFLATPSARRATHGSLHRAPSHRISIHALREEGDQFRPRS